MKKVIKINIIILVIFCLVINFSIIKIYADEIPEIDAEPIAEEDDRTDEEKKVDELKDQMSDVESNLFESNQEIEIIKNEVSDEVAEISKLNQEILDKELEISTLEAQEENISIYVEAAEDEYNKVSEKYENEKDLLEQRLVAMYEMGETSFLDLLFSSKSISEFLSNYYMISQISNSDIDFLKTVEGEKKYREDLKNVLEEKKSILANSRETRKNEAIVLQNMTIIKNSRLVELNEEQGRVQQEIEQYQNDIIEIEKEIRKIALENISSRYVGGEMAWPVPGYTRITSRFGMRTHPITGVYKLHTGVDIGAPMGAAFVAANDGVVTYAGWNRAYGNMVTIDHGGGITTLYGHGSEILVSTGDVVGRGQQVLKVGSTGYSTGPHAHFEVRVNGEYVEPLDYITSY